MKGQGQEGGRESGELGQSEEQAHDMIVLGLVSKLIVSHLISFSWVEKHLNN